MSEIAIKVEQLGKKYIIGHQRSGDLREAFGRKVKHFFGGDAEQREEFWALKDLNFEIRRGEVVGIIGRNGAGKSTLLKILSRITDPSTGRFSIDGRVSSLLEVGTGFHAELTGRENIYLNGTILGMRRAEIKRKFDEIVAFSGVENFIDTPVKHYSSGMKVRLAFSVAAHLEPEILIIDEVLAVGDAEFQKKCLGKMDEVSKREGRTILFVSHNLAAVEHLCQKAIYLNKGLIEYNGSINTGINYYLKEHSQSVPNTKSGLYVEKVKIRNQDSVESITFKYGENILVDFFISEKFSSLQHNIGFYIIDSVGNKIGAASTVMRNPNAIFHDLTRDDYISFTLISPPVMEGDYSIDLSITNKTGGRLEYMPSVAGFNIVATDIYGTGAKINSHLGKIYFNIETSFYTKEIFSPR